MIRIDDESYIDLSKDRKFLVVCRAGDNSLHKQWLIPVMYRNFDLIIDYYGDQESRYKNDADIYSENKGTKWPSIYRVIKSLGERLLQYEAVWFPDDDLSTNALNINKMFNVFQKNKLSLAQPALTQDSFFSHSITVENSSMILRYTNFVEVMAPVFSRYALIQCLSSFKKSQTGWGLDAAWPSILGQPRENIAIIDATPVKHTRPIGKGDIYRDMTSNPQKEFDQIVREYRVDLPFLYQIYGGIMAKESIGSDLKALMSLEVIFAIQMLRGTPKELTFRPDHISLLYPHLIYLLDTPKSQDAQSLNSTQSLAPEPQEKSEIHRLFKEIEENRDISHSIDKLAYFRNELILECSNSFLGDIVRVLNHIATRFLELNMTDRILQFLQKALEFDESSQDTLYNLGYVLYLVEEYQLALTYLNRMTEIEEDTETLIADVKRKMNKVLIL